MSESIQINNETLTFNKIWYVDAVNGNDSNDGSINSPLKTFTHAYNSCSSGDALYLKGVEGANYNDYTGSINKDISIIGDGLLSKMDFARLDVWQNSTGSVKFYKVYISALDIFIYSAIPIYYFYNCILSIQYGTIAWDYTHYYNVFVYNCTLLDINLKYEWGRMKTTFENCLISSISEYSNSGYNAYGVPILITTQYNDAFLESYSSTTKPSSTLNWSFSSDYKPIGIGWQNIGTGLNPDGSQAHIGVYGGPYAWGQWKVKINSINYNIIEG